jgi:hypothetical protein
MRANEFIVEYRLSVSKDADGVAVKATAGGKSLGHAEFFFDEQGRLDPQTVWVDERYHGQGIAADMYDHLKDLGYTIVRSWDQTDAGRGFWNKHRGEDAQVWETEQTPAEKFIADIYNEYPQTFQNNHVMPFSSEEFAMFELKPSISRRGAVEVYWFQAYPLRSGVGSRAMQVLQDRARKHGVALTLVPWDKGQVSQAALTKFYKRQGFKPTIKGGRSLSWEPLEEISRDRLERYLSRAGRQVDTRQERMARARQRLNTSYEIYRAEEPTKIVDRFEADTPADAQRYYQDYIERYESDRDYDLRLRRGTGIMEVTMVNTQSKSKSEHLDIMPNDGEPIPPGEEADYLGKLVAELGDGYQLWSWNNRGTVTYYVFDTDTRTSQLGTTGRPYPSNPDSFVIQGVYSGPKNQYRAADLYAFLILDQGLTLISDNKQSEGGYRVWQELERRYGRKLNIHGFDTRTDEPVNVTTQDEPDTHVSRADVKRAGPKMKKELGSISRDLRFVASAR